MYTRASPKRGLEFDRKNISRRGVFKTVKTFECACGASLFFDSFSCLNCGRPTGFDPAQRSLFTLEEAGTNTQRYTLVQADTKALYALCDNQIQHGVCNWLLPATDKHTLCISCRLNHTIPNLAEHENLRRWGSLESAKRRMILGLLDLGLPFPARSRLGGATLSFQFLEDARTNPYAYLQHVSTGHLDGQITINVAEADDALREQARTDLNESYRTLLGHFRHESGHYYWGVLIADSVNLQSFRETFGDERIDYAQALETYYAGAQGNVVPGLYVSDYARAHPLEDWAETWAHYLHMHDILDTAHAWGLTTVTRRDGFSARMTQWRRGSVFLNELNRSLGARDPYPFVIGAGAADKLHYIDKLIDGLQAK